MLISLLQDSFTSTKPRRNAERVLELARQAAARGAKLCVAPELCLSGVFPGDLLLNPHYIDQCRAALDWLAAELGADGPAVLAGSPLYGRASGSCWEANGEGELPQFVLNAAALVQAGRVSLVASQKNLGTVTTLDYARYFSAGAGLGGFCLDGVQFGVVLGYDVLTQAIKYPCSAASGQKDAAEGLLEVKALDEYAADSLSAVPDVLLCLSAVPFFGSGEFMFSRCLAELAGGYSRPLAVVNALALAGGTVFGGGAAGYSRTGALLSKAGRFAPESFDLEVYFEQGLPAAQAFSGQDGRIMLRPATAGGGLAKAQGREQSLFAALCFGVRAFFAENACDRAWLGLSGGLDSALCAVLVAEALGPEALTGVLMPSPFTSRESLELAQTLAGNLGIASRVIPIEPLMDAFAASLPEDYASLPRGVAEENLQARIRGTLLMALSNKFGGLVICPGNKSEIAVGYSTLYGDSVGALAVIGDIYKTTVRELACWYNLRAGRDIIPAGIIERPPSAELSPGQVDEDSLPPYPILDNILYQYIEEGRTVEEIRRAGVDGAVIAEVVAKVRRAEFKRRQAPPVIEVSARPFGHNWRMPLNAGR